MSAVKISPALECFFNSYIETALWASNDNANDQGGEPLDKNYGPDNLAPETLETMIEECGKFLDANRDAIGDRYRTAGHDFWLTRNHHGAGFWDGDWEDDGDALTDSAYSFGERDLYIGDDGKIYQERG